MNYVIDGETFDVPIKMDTIEGETLFILDGDLILDTDTPYFTIKNALDDSLTNLKNTFNKIMNNWDKYKVAFIAVGCGILGLIILVPVMKFIITTKVFLGKNGDEEKKE